MSGSHLIGTGVSTSRRDGPPKDTGTYHSETEPEGGLTVGRSGKTKDKEHKRFEQG